jgi:hypothetical protein
MHHECCQLKQAYLAQVPSAMHRQFACTHETLGCITVLSIGYDTYQLNAMPLLTSGTGSKAVGEL